MKLSDAPTFPPIRAGLRVMTPLGSGTILYARQSQNRQWEAASVRLNSTSNGTVFPADKIALMEEW